VDKTSGYLLKESFGNCFPNGLRDMTQSSPGAPPLSARTNHDRYPARRPNLLKPLRWSQPTRSRCRSIKKNNLDMSLSTPKKGAGARIRPLTGTQPLWLDWGSTASEQYAAGTKVAARALIAWWYLPRKKGHEPNNHRFSVSFGQLVLISDQLAKREDGRYTKSV
jgi:hypothetical protein